MILIGNGNSFSTRQEWMDRIVDWHQFCVEQGLNPWEHLTTQDGSFYVSIELYSLRQVVQKAS